MNKVLFFYQILEILIFYAIYFIYPGRNRTSCNININGFTFPSKRQIQSTRTGVPGRKFENSDRTKLLGWKTCSHKCNIYCLNIFTNYFIKIRRNNTDIISYRFCLARGFLDLFKSTLLSKKDNQKFTFRYSIGFSRAFPTSFAYFCSCLVCDIT